MFSVTRPAFAFNDLIVIKLFLEVPVSTPQRTNLDINPCSSQDRDRPTECLPTKNGIEGCHSVRGINATPVVVDVTNLICYGREETFLYDFQPR